MMIPDSAAPMPRRPNLLVIVSDEHAADVTGCYGHAQIRTPHLDRLASAGTVFDNAYCNSPICVPSRLSLFSGKYPHHVGAWDNGAIPGPDYATWGHFLEAAGYETVLNGRTHFNGDDRRRGFGRRLLDDWDGWRHEGKPPRRSLDQRRSSNSHVSECGPGSHRSDAYDTAVTAHARQFLLDKAATAGSDQEDRPWALYCGFIRPHFPLIAPPEFYAWYSPDQVHLPPTWKEAIDRQHPVVQQLRRSFRNDEPISEALVRRATASYWALVSSLDHNVGQLLEVIDGTELRKTTMVLYTSDHGEMAGHHGIWQKHCFYEPSVRVPLMLRLPAGYTGGELSARVTENVSLVDVLPTLLDLAGCDVPPALPGKSLLRVARRSLSTRRDVPPPAGWGTVFSEYHAQGMVNGGFMVKQGDLKYCYYVGHRPQLFDTRADPLELHDLIDDPSYAPRVAELHHALLAIGSPEHIDAAARRDQEERRAVAPARVDLRERARANEE
jgi:choline-sulfatase